MNNPVYGKTTEYLRNRIDVRLVRNEKDYLKQISKPSYVCQKDYLTMIQSRVRKSKVVLTRKKPAYVGMCILVSSKVLIYEFNYDYIKIKYGNNSRLLFTDTDVWNV